MQVINPYIECMRAEDHLLFREGATVYLENTLISYILWRDGKFQKENTQTKKTDVIVERIITYVTNDMVFIPVNVIDIHWYLAVINGKKREIQVLDSIGSFRRDDVTYILQGIQRQIEITIKEIKDLDFIKWPDLNILSWPVIEIFKKQMQEDSVSCGLFMLNYMEYWTGEKLTDDITQPHPISITLKKLKEILDVSKPMDKDCFNMAVRMIACEEIT
ncbi:hypothetical protein HU200_052114 [Digitaria exilis]|uniref:Ubiquitin-like protease family profile domain-containing protein n=1 Tax=Digitaria exilis TaxID=1010633 RepID=A0A835AR06_9POAL|nr:hypothetical protein HU200_052114 [Digitaria exilis]